MDLRWQNLKVRSWPTQILADYMRGQSDRKAVTENCKHEFNIPDFRVKPRKYFLLTILPFVVATGLVVFATISYFAPHYHQWFGTNKSPAVVALTILAIVYVIVINQIVEHASYLPEFKIDKRSGTFRITTTYLDNLVAACNSRIKSVTFLYEKELAKIDRQISSYTHKLEVFTKEIDGITKNIDKEEAVLSDLSKRMADNETALFRYADIYSRIRKMNESKLQREGQGIDIASQIQLLEKSRTELEYVYNEYVDRTQNHYNSRIKRYAESAAKNLRTKFSLSEYVYDECQKTKGVKHG